MSMYTTGLSFQSLVFVAIPENIIKLINRSENLNKYYEVDCSLQSTHLYPISDSGSFPVIHVT
jgi:hypothetical protein